MEKDKLRKNKLTVCALTVCAALCVCACGENAGTNPNTIILKNPASGQTQEQDNDVMQENVDSPAEDDQQRDGIGTDTESDTNVSNSDSSVTVVMVSEDDVELTTDDGTVYYTITCSYPVVSIADNEAAAGKINADIRTRVDAYNTSVNAQAEIAKADFEYLLNDDDYDFTPYAYSSDLSFTVTRADDHVIAFTENSYEYMGGAHGLPNTIGINYDTDTGELITFGDLSDDPDAFRADTLTYNQELARTEYYSMQMFNTDDITNGTLEETLYADGMWYLSTSGLVFMSPPYALAPYASGTLEFTIPYSELTDMGFKDTYAYTGRQIMKLMENESYSMDLNGDGNDDSITYYIEWVENESGGLDARSHLTINDLDYAQDGTEDVKDQLISSWGLQFRLYDLDVDDDYVELAGIVEVWTQKDEDSKITATRYSRFFRYMEDGSLIYLGEADGDVTDPSSSVTVSGLRGGSY